MLRGESGVGCNCLANASIGEEFNPNEGAVNGPRFKEIKFFVNHREIKVGLWNGPGQERYRSLMKFFLNDTNILIFVYDITMKNSFDHLNELIEEAKDKLGNNFIGAIVANKSDLYDEEAVSEKEARIFAKEQNYKFYLVSAKESPQSFINCLDELVKDYILAFHPNLLA